MVKISYKSMQGNSKLTDFPETKELVLRHFVPSQDTVNHKKSVKAVDIQLFNFY